MPKMIQVEITEKQVATLYSAIYGLLDGPANRHGVTDRVTKHRTAGIDLKQQSELGEWHEQMQQALQEMAEFGTLFDYS